MSEWNKIKEEIELLSKSKNGSPKEGKKQKIAYHFKKIMEELDLDLSDDSLAKTPERVAKMYVDELFSGLDEKNEPSISQFENNYKYKGIILEKDIQLYSICEHHFVPIIGKAHVAYIANEKIIGLSKINRVVSYFSKRPQVQEKLTVQIVNYLKKVLETNVFYF